MGEQNKSEKLSTLVFFFITHLVLLEELLSSSKHLKKAPKLIHLNVSNLAFSPIFVLFKLARLVKMFIQQATS